MKIEEIVGIAILLAGGYYLYKNPSILDRLFKKDSGSGSSSTGGGTRGGGSSGGGTGTGTGTGSSGSGSSSSSLPGTVLFDSTKEWTSAKSLSDGASFGKIAKVGGSSVKINGDGSATMSGTDAVRFYLGISNKNVEMSGIITPNSSLDNLSMNLRSAHLKSCGFGGYHGVLEFREQKSYTKKELTHGNGYSDRTGSVNFPKNAAYGQKHGFRMRVFNEGSGVRVQTFIDIGATGNFVRLVNFLDTGNYTNISGAASAAECSNAKDYVKPVTGSMPNAWIRLNGASVKNVTVSNIVVKEIAASAQSSITYAYPTLERDSYPIPLQNRGYPIPVRSIDREGL